MSFFERYTSGDEAAVCEELCSLGEQVFSEKIPQDAVAVAREFVTRSIHNLTLIYQRLVELGYQFDQPEKALRLKTVTSFDDVTLFEAEMGALPIVLREWYSRVISLEFGQAEKQYIDKKSDLRGLGWHGDFSMPSLEDAKAKWNKFASEEYPEYRAHWVRQGFGDEYPENPGRTLLLTGCDAVSIPLPCRTFDVEVRELWERPPMLNELFRSGFQRAGFPVLRVYDSLSIKSIVPRPNVEKIFPFLIEGLVDV